jgi:hypothetical protein
MTNVSFARRSIPVADAPPGAPKNVAPPWVPLVFFAAGALGLIGAGIALMLSADHAVLEPTHPSVVSAVHTVMLMFMTVTTVGALHLFAPMVGGGGKTLRSLAAVQVTAVAIVFGTWILAGGFAHGPNFLVPLGGSVTATAFAIAVWNISGPLRFRGGDVTVRGLRFSLTFLLLTACFGVLYAFDRNAGWFPLLPNRVLAHAHLGILGWLGLTYISMAEKLWPMFLMSKRERTLDGAIAVTFVAGGLFVFVPALLFDVRPLVIAGAFALLVGLAAHLVSLVRFIVSSENAVGVLHVGIVVSAGFLIWGVVLGGVALLADVTTAMRSVLVAAEVMALSGWLVIAIVSHAHKIVPSLIARSLREHGMLLSPQGMPLIAADVSSSSAGHVAVGLLSGAWTLGVIALLAQSSWLFAFAGGLIAVSAVVAVANLAFGGRRLRRKVSEQL